MARKPDLDALLKGNPQAAANRDKIERAQRIVGKLQASGVELHTYDLRRPFSGEMSPAVPNGRFTRAVTPRGK